MCAISIRVPLAGRFLLAVAGLMLQIPHGRAQSQTSPPAFEVISIKPSPPGDEGRTPWRFKQNPGGISYSYASVNALLLKAFGIEDYQLTLPRGYHSDEWDVVARAPANSRIEDIPMMLRSLLIDRFKLAFHYETKELAVYELVVAKGGAKVKDVGPPEGGLGGNRTAEGLSHWKGRVPMKTLVYALTGTLRTPVIDKTGLAGIYEIEFQHAPLTKDPGDDSLLAASAPGPTISRAMEEALGLRLEPRKSGVQILVVDHIEKTPTGN